MARPLHTRAYRFLSPTWFVVFALAALAGCQESAEPNARPSAGQPATAAHPPSRPPATAEAPATSEAGSTRPGANTPGAAARPAEAEAPPATEPAADEGAFAEQLAAVEALEDQAEYYKALQKIWELKDRYAGDRDRLGRLQRLDNELRDKRLQAVRFDRQVEKLGSPNPALRRHATREILQSGDLAFVLLGKAVREQQGPTLEAVVDLLVRRRHWPAAVAFVDRLLADPNVAQADLLIDSARKLVTNADDTGRDPLRPAMRQVGRRLWAAAPPHPHTLELARLWRMPLANWFDGNAEAYRQWLGDREGRPPLLGELPEDRAFAHREAVAALAEVYRKVLQRDRSALNALAGDDDAITALRDYAARAASADRAELADWAEPVTRALAVHDYEALARGLLLHWTFDKAPEDAERVIDSSGNDWHGQMHNGKAPRLEGIQGRALSFDGKGTCVDSPTHKTFKKLHHGDYSLSVWVRPAGWPGGEQPDPMAQVLGKEGWHVGLQISKTGEVLMNHVLDNNESVKAPASEPLKLGRWYHLVGVVDRTNGRVKLYVDGELQPVAEFPPDAKASNRQDDSPVRLGAARKRKIDWWYRYDGLADEVRVYNRALSDADVAAIRSLVE